MVDDRFSLSILPHVEISVVEDGRELRLVLHGTLQPAEPLRELSGRGGNGVDCDLQPGTAARVGKWGYKIEGDQFTFPAPLASWSRSMMAATLMVGIEM